MCKLFWVQYPPVPPAPSEHRNKRTRPAHKQSRPQLPPSPSPDLSITGSPHSSPPLSLFFQKHRERRRSSTASNGFPGNANLFPGNANLPDLVQQSTSPLVSPGDASGAQVGGAAAPNCWPLNPTPPYPTPDPDRPAPLHLFTL